MKFPLAQAPFPPLNLCDSDKQAVVELADLFVSQTLGDYEIHLEDDQGVVNEARWKMVKRFENVVVYQDREAVHPRRLTQDGRRPEQETVKDMQKLLWFGTITGNLDDLMYAVVNPTADDAKVKAAFVGSNVLDFAVLDSIVHPTPDDPFRGLQIKWAVNGGPALMRTVVRCRDFVYIESTGMTMSSTGERIGYHILHSIAVPGAPELHEHKVIRGNMTLYHLYRQKSEGVVETYVKAFIDVMGDMPASVATFVATKGVVSCCILPAVNNVANVNPRWRHSEKETIKAISDDILVETMAEYERMLVQGNGVLDTERWKLIKRKENLAAYQDRCALAVTLQTSSSTTKPTEDPISPPPAPAPTVSAPVKTSPQRVLWHGTINCDLDDLMLGVVNQNADMWKVKSSYVEDNGLDYFLLASITERSMDKPFEGLQLRWTVNDLGPLVTKAIVRPRDFVYMESTGITQSPTTGERMGYHISHSLELPGIPELPEFKLVRGKIEFYHIFRQKSKGVVEVYVRALCDLQGEMPSQTVTSFSAEAMSSLSLVAFCAERHKVMWLLYTMEPCETGKVDLCTVCMKDLSKSLLPFMNKACRICSGRICSRCRIPKRISFLNRRTRGVIKKNIDICTRCVHTSAHMSALIVAQGELALENPTAIFYEAAASSRSIPSFSSAS
ncbi:hypothetical protein BBO99_00000430 [Phytophthora kernoviae]|uniref:START domain-containing protein n=1 Tax=Phytophthora kernoviae TaxID=325452 RepID=A0A3R7HNW8_9STRA|nr:hypothetical protein JM16_004185 [Phytophthora kernoviae]RLN20620.1 hypothetical protein BBI17_004505 [Phytophthora kernoviae]RLN85527.1 hypothetical protein BBO99_00000430 [Phytophthora kernoviae]